MAAMTKHARRTHHSHASGIRVDANAGPGAPEWTIRPHLARGDDPSFGFETAAVEMLKLQEITGAPSLPPVETPTR